MKEENGTTVFICRAHCSQDAIRQAVDMEWSDFFPEGVHSVSLKRAFPAADVLHALADEALIAAVAASNIANGVELTPADKERLMVAAQRIEAARRMTLDR